MDTYSHFPGIIHIHFIAIGEDTGSVELAHNTHIPMMTSSRETFSALLAICAGNSPVTGEFPPQRPVRRSFDVFFDLRLNKRLSKQSRMVIWNAIVLVMTSR